jgi:hypothetical protein
MHKAFPDDISGAAQLHKLSSMAGLRYAQMMLGVPFPVQAGMCSFRCGANVAY